MFFIGISAHLFIYLLVPAFLVVCFYFRGTSASPEAVTLLPEMIVYEHSTTVSTEQTYVFQVTSQQEAPRKEQTEYPECSPSLQGFVPQVSFYHSPIISGKTLRSPPFSF